MTPLERIAVALALALAVGLPMGYLWLVFLARLW
jgi:hypothetical protein